MKRLFENLFCGLLLFVLAFSAHAQSDPLPSGIFKALEDGESRTVITYGTSVTIGGEWAAEVELYFNRLYPGQVTFFNSAKSGMHSDWGVENLQERVLDKHPDLVFLEFAINDAATKHGISTDDCRRNLDTMIKAIRAQNPAAEIVLQTMNPAWDSPASAPKKYASDRPNLADYYEVYRSYAGSDSLPLVDQYPVWKKVLDEDPERYHEMVPDGIHPDCESSREVAWPNVKALLDRARVFASADAVVDVWPAGAVPGADAEEPEGVAFPDRTDAVRITHVSRPTMALYSASGLAGPAPAVIVCPGGSYRYCVADKEGTDIAEWLNTIGIHALVLKYRTPDNRAGALQDIHRAIRVVRENAAAWNIDPERIGVLGFSAGGNLCAKAGNLFNMSSYTAVDAADTVSCRPDFCMLVYPAYLEENGKLAPYLKMDADIPPTLMVHTDDDARFIAGSRMYAEAMHKARHACRFLLYPTGGHGYGLRCDGDAKAWPTDAEAWLRETGLLR